ncbi:hypothetical protein [Mucilaginibacter aquatilis]|uniref:Uncharacterized protein n=1 Tax=Mucilaginibacter aquatilis TaxID=1517760 RepID=A0A6I4I5U2_9SPHI|nr:hypothetical protein [Mucilaginibacter aquatilis]MVN90490.1 hypothetical protein [Mucilaginibacter aquatilis]
MLRILFFILFCATTNAYAGWYECYNFEGTIGKFPITLSMQVRKGYFGEPAKKKFNVIGVYKYNKYNSPIRLEGIFDERSKQVTLYEVSGKSYSAVLQFVFSEKQCPGSWQNKATVNKLRVSLTFVSKLLDLEPEQVFSGVDILQAQSLTRFYFIACYNKVSGADKAVLSELKIFQKNNGKIFQVIDLSNVEDAIGNIMTIIYDNLEVVDAEKQKVGLSRNVGNDQAPLIIEWNASSKRFTLEKSSIHE